MGSGIPVQGVERKKGIKSKNLQILSQKEYEGCDIVERGISDKTKYLIKLIIVTAAVYFCVKYLLPIILPFLIAYLLKLILRPAVSLLENKFKIKRKVSSIILLLIISGILICLFILFAGTLSAQVKKLIKNSEYYEEKIDRITDRTCCMVEKYSGIESREIKNYLNKGIDRLFDSEQNSHMVVTVMNKSVNTIMIIGECIVIIFTAILAAYYMLVGNGGRKPHDKCEQKQQLLSELRVIVKRVTSVCSAYVKTQLVIMFITFIICFISFLIIKNDYALLAAFVVGVLDSLPLIGVGTILVPWGIIYLILGNYFYAAVIFITFFICYLVRELLEPRLMGTQIGITPLMTIASMYVGYKLFGIVGVVLGPISYIMISAIMEEVKL